MREAQEFATLPDYLEPGLDLVFVGINPGLYSVAQGHYFARKTSRFWPAFSASKLSRNVRSGLRLDILTPQHDALLPRFGIGFTDVVKRPTANVSELTSADFDIGFLFSSTSCGITNLVLHVSTESWGSGPFSKWG